MRVTVSSGNGYTTARIALPLPSWGRDAISVHERDGTVTLSMSDERWDRLTDALRRFDLAPLQGGKVGNRILLLLDLIRDEWDQEEGQLSLFEWPYA